MEDTAERVKKVLVNHLCCDAEKVTPEATLEDDLGADSLDIVELELAFEEEFGFRFPQDGVFELNYTVDQVITTIDQARAG